MPGARAGSSQKPSRTVVDDAISELHRIRTGHGDGSSAREEEGGGFSAVSAKASRRRRLSNVGSLSDAYSNYGFATGDRIEKRDQVTMFKEMRGSMEEYLGGMARDGRYDAAVDLRDRMDHVTEQFQNTMLATEQTRQADERAMVKEASGKVLRKLKAHWREERRAAERMCDQSVADIVEDNAVHTQVLERDIAHAPRPRIKFSKTLLDMKTAEHELCKQHRFEEAKEVRRRADVVQRKEEEAHDAWVAMEEELTRHRWAEKAEELEHERTMNAKQCIVNAKHHQDLDVKTTQWRMAHNAKDMRHAHTMDTVAAKRYLKANMVSVRPVVASRAGHEATSSSLKGTHMHKATAEGRAAVSSLSANHDFGGTVDGIETLDAREGSMMDRTARQSARTFGLHQGGLGGTL